MKKWFFFALHSLCWTLCYAQNQDLLPATVSQNAFKAGEWFEFRIHYGVFNASRVTLELNADSLDQTPVFHAKGYGRTTGLARLFFKVEDHYESYFGQKDGLPRWFIRDINEGGYTKDLEIRFDHEKKRPMSTIKKRKRKLVLLSMKMCKILFLPFTICAIFMIPLPLKKEKI